jgi:hypothetical protein
VKFFSLAFEVGFKKSSLLNLKLQFSNPSLMKFFGGLTILDFLLKHKNFLFLFGSQLLKFLLLVKGGLEASEFLAHAFEFVLPETTGKFNVKTGEGSGENNLLKVLLEFLEMELGRHDGFLKHLDVVCVRVKTVELLKVLVELDLLQDLGNEVDTADETFHVGFEANVRVGAALSHVSFEQLQKILEEDVHLGCFPCLRAPSVKLN